MKWGLPFLLGGHPPSRSIGVRQAALGRGPTEEEMPLLALLSLRMQFSACSLLKPMASTSRVESRGSLEYISAVSLKTSDSGDQI